jgi:hypothetical protein
MEENGRIRLSTFHGWYKTDGKFEQSLARGRKGFRCFEDMSPFFSLDLKHEGLRYESVLEKKFDLPLVAICAYTRQSIEQLDSPAIELLHQHHSRLIGSP